MPVLATRAANGNFKYIFNTMLLDTTSVIGFVDDRWQSSFGIDNDMEPIMWQAIV